MVDGGWRMADGGWRMADGRWRTFDLQTTDYRQHPLPLFIGVKWIGGDPLQRHERSEDAPDERSPEIAPSVAPAEGRR